MKGSLVGRSFALIVAAIFVASQAGAQPGAQGQGKTKGKGSSRAKAPPPPSSFPLWGRRPLEEPSAAR